MNNLEKLINNISKGKNLSFEESKTIFLNIMNGKMTEDLIYKLSYPVKVVNLKCIEVLFIVLDQFSKKKAFLAFIMVSQPRYPVNYYTQLFV